LASESVWCQYQSSLDDLVGASGNVGEISKPKASAILRLTTRSGPALSPIDACAPLKCPRRLPLRQSQRQRDRADRGASMRALFGERAPNPRIMPREEAAESTCSQFQNRAVHHGEREQGPSCVSDYCQAVSKEVDESADPHRHQPRRHHGMDGHRRKAPVGEHLADCAAVIGGTR
jgi:hypothetical protein